MASPLGIPWEEIGKPVRKWRAPKSVLPTFVVHTTGRDGRDWFHVNALDAAMARSIMERKGYNVVDVESDVEGSES